MFVGLEDAVSDAGGVIMYLKQCINLKKALADVAGV